LQLSKVVGYSLQIVIAKRKGNHHIAQAERHWPAGDQNAPRAHNQGAMQ
jgi:hypothetical protein